MENRIISKQLLYNGEEWIPAGTEITNVTVIAGKGTNIVLRAAENLSDTYGGLPGDWYKCAGKVCSGKYIFDIHWEENDEIGMVRQKIKYFKERKR